MSAYDRLAMTLERGLLLIGTLSLLTIGLFLLLGRSVPDGVFLLSLGGALSFFAGGCWYWSLVTAGVVAEEAPCHD